MEVGVKIVGDEEVFIHKVGCLLIDDKLLVISIAMSGFVVSTCDVLKCH